MKIPEKYQDVKSRHEKELNAFEGIFFAFNNSQFEKGMGKVGLNKEETTKIYSLSAGGYILKERSKAFNDMFKRHTKELKEAKKEEQFLLNALIYELKNHEYCITYDTREALESLDINIDDIDQKLLNKACKLALK